MRKLLLIGLLTLVGCQKNQPRDKDYDYSIIPEPEVITYLGTLDKGSATVFSSHLEGRTIYVFLDGSQEALPFHPQGANYPTGPVYGVFGDSVYIVQAQSYLHYQILIYK